MESNLAKVLSLQSEPVAIVWTDEKPEGATQFEPGKWGCVMAMFAAAATKGKICIFDKETYGCVGGGLGLGFGNTYLTFAGGIDGFCRFLSNGNEQTEAGRKIGEGMKAAGARLEFIHHFLHGERYKKNPEIVKSFVDALPIMEVPTRYVAFVPLSSLERVKGEPISITLLANPDQLSALVVFSNYDRPGLDNVAIPYVAGCQSIGIMGYREAKSASQRGIVGMMDISARNYMRAQVGSTVLTFTLPFSRFQEMEANVPGSFLEEESWKALVKPQIKE